MSPSLSEWFDRIEAAGLRAGVRERMLAHGLLIRLARRGELPEAAADRFRLLGPLLCASAEQQRDYARMLDELAAGGGGGGVVRSLPEGVALPESARGPWAVFVGLVAVVVLVVVWLVWPVLVGGSSAEGVTPPPPGASKPAGPASSVIQIDPAASPGSAFAVSASDIPQPVHVPQRPLQWAAPKSPTWAAALRAGLAVVGGLALLVLGWRLWRHLRLRKPYLEAQEQRDDEVEQRLLRDCDEPERMPIGPVASVLAPVSRALRQRTEGDRHTLDVRATIAASIRHGGRVLQPVWRPVRQTPEYLALVERAGAGDHQARYHEAVVEALRSRGVTIELFFYRQSPEHGCWRLAAAGDEEDGAGGFRRSHDRVSVTMLLARFSQHRLLVFGDAGGALDPDTGESQPWTVPARLFAQRAWFTPRPVANWGRAEHWVSEAAGLDVLLLPMEDAALGTLADWLASGRARLVQHPQAPYRYPSLLQADELDWAARRVAPPPELLARLMVELRSYLGPQRMRWLAACAVFPTLAWPLTLMLGRRVFDREGDDDVRALGVATLGALPWFRYGRLPNWLRGPLLDELSADEAVQLREALLQRLERAVTPQKDEASVADRPVLARVSRLRLRAWLRGRRDALSRDLLMVRFLEPSLAPKLAQQLPAVFRRWLFRDGSPLRGLRPAVEALLVLPLLAGVAAMPGVWERVGPGMEMTAVAAQQWPVGAGVVVKALGVSADGWQVCTRSADDTVRRWRASTGAAITGDGWCAETVEATRATRPDGLQTAQFANGRITLTTTARSNVVSTTVAGRPGTALTNQATATYSAELAQAAVTGLAYSPDGSQLASAGADGRVVVWDVTTAKEIKTLATGTTAWRSIAYSTDGQRVLAADAAGRLQVWEVLTGDLVTAVSASTLAGGDIQARFAADGSALFAAGKDGQVHRWGAAPPQAVAVLGCVTTDAVPRVDATARAQADRLANLKAADKLPALAPVAYTPAMWQTLGHGTAQQIPAKREILVPASQPEALATAQTLAAWLSQETPTQAAWTVRGSEAALSMPTLSTCDVTLPETPKPAEPQLDPVAWPQAAADTARNGQLQTALNAVFSTNRASRVQATQKVIADADLVSDLLPMALQRAQARSSFDETLMLVQGAMPVTLQRHATEIYRLLASLPAETDVGALRQKLLTAKGQRPKIFLQIADESQRAAAVKLQAQLRKLGLDAPGVEKMASDKVPEQAELRVWGRSDQALARWLAKGTFGKLAGGAPGVVWIAGGKPEALVDTYELWLPKEAAVGVLPVGTRFRDCADDTCPWMVVIPAGKFQMGSPANEEGRDTDEGPQHEVTIAQPLAVMEAEVTRGQFAAFVKATGHDTAGTCSSWTDAKVADWRNPGFVQTEEHPVVCVSWNDAQAYAKWLTGKTGQAYRLLSEAEWEYAARARTQTRYSFGNKAEDLCAYANFADKSAKAVGGLVASWASDVCSDGFTYTAPVKTYKPNAFGLFGLHGNAWEWVQDCWHGDYNGAPVTGVSWETNCKEERRVLRGGGWDIIPSGARAASRGWDSPGNRINDAGFRLARTLTP